MSFHCQGKKLTDPASWTSHGHTFLLTWTHIHIFWFLTPTTKELFTHNQGPILQSQPIFQEIIYFSFSPKGYQSNNSSYLLHCQAPPFYCNICNCIQCPVMALYNLRKNVSFHFIFHLLPTSSIYLFTIIPLENCYWWQQFISYNLSSCQYFSF